MRFILFLRGIVGMCPNCGRGRLWRGLFGVQQQCSHCGLVFESKPGDFTGASVLSYSVTTAAALISTFAFYFLAEPPLMTLMIFGLSVTVIVAVITYQPLKGLWIAFQVQVGWLKPPQ